MVTLIEKIAQTGRFLSNSAGNCHVPNIQIVSDLSDWMYLVLMPLCRCFRYEGTEKEANEAECVRQGTFGYLCPAEERIPIRFANRQ